MNPSALARDQGISVLPAAACYLCGSRGRRTHAGLRDVWLGVPGEWSFRHCRRCRLAWLDPRPERGELPSLYRDGYYTHAPSPEPQRRGAGTVRRLVRTATLPPESGRGARADVEGGAVERLLGRALARSRALKDVANGSVMWIHDVEPGKLLDVGCGDGSFLALMRDLGWDVWGLEPDPLAARVALQRGLRVIRATIEEAQLPGESFGAVTMSHVIEHVPDPIEALRASGRLLRRDGLLVIVTPNAASIGRYWFGHRWNGWEVPRHLFLFTPRSLRACATRAGLEVTDLRTTARSAFRMLPNVRAHVRLLSRWPAGSGEPGARGRAPALLLWLLEHTLSYAVPCGEEIVMVARRRR